MAAKKSSWKKGRGKLGLFDPLIGSWVAAADSPMGKLTCTRTFERILGGNYIQLTAVWDFGKGAYTEHAIIGIKDGIISFWSFTSDGKNSAGQLSDGSDVHPDAICFEAKMPAGTARMIYWPNEEADGFNWAVESKTKKGWNRFTMHRYGSCEP
jgi:hypothetical protein